MLATIMGESNGTDPSASLVSTHSLRRRSFLGRVPSQLYSDGSRLRLLLILVLPLLGSGLGGCADYVDGCSEPCLQFLRFITVYSYVYSDHSLRSREWRHSVNGGQLGGFGWT
jgi:hypothetical protein